jgi:hypothetical protein
MEHPMNSLLNRIGTLLNPMASSSPRRRKSGPGGYKPSLEVLEGRLALATLELSGTFTMESISGTVGSDLAAIVGHDNGWTLALDQVSYSHAEEHNTRGCDYDSTVITRIHAASYQFTFTGPDAALLNDAVANHFVGGGLDGGAVLEATNVTCIYSRIGDDNHGEYTLHLAPMDQTAGVSLAVQNLWTVLFPQDSEGWPKLPAVMVDSYAGTTLVDQRSGNDGSLNSAPDEVRIGNFEPPPPPPMMKFAADVARPEGKKGWTAFVFTVTLSAPSDQTITVEYSTENGSATAGQDYYAVERNTLVFNPGETSKSITIWVKGDPKREANESFFLRLGSATNAVIEDELALGMILNDD